MRIKGCAIGVVFDKEDEVRFDHNGCHVSLRWIHFRLTKLKAFTEKNLSLAAIPSDVQQNENMNFQRKTCT
jgi:hypothetical protein